MLGLNPSSQRVLLRVTGNSSPAHYVTRVTRRGVKVRGLWYDDPDVLRDYRGTASSRGGRRKGRWVIRRDPRDRRSVFFQDPVRHAWHAVAWEYHLKCVKELHRVIK